MALPTPRRLARPSLGNSSSNISSSPTLHANSTAVNRKASLNALTGQAAPSTPVGDMVGGDGRDIEVDDMVDVPGGMYGTVRFIGNVHGKKGIFAGVELASEFAARGKNDGDVDGVSYFKTSIPGSGIFLPLHRASKRESPSATSDSFPPTPTTPYQNYSLKSSTSEYARDAPTMKFSQSVGPGARAPSPIFRPKLRQSLPRPESPQRRSPSTPSIKPPLSTAGSLRSGSLNQRSTPSPAPARLGAKQTRTPGSARPYSRNNSRLGHTSAIAEDSELTPVGRKQSNRSSLSSARQSKVETGHADIEVQRLTQQIEERDKQLREQAASLAEMETNLAELQLLIPTDDPASLKSSLKSGGGEADAAQLKALLREKNEKISLLTSEFDAHRADFRSTIDTLEMASTETERVYEKKIEDLILQVKELQERSEDVDSVAKQFKQLEELVQELEEGLEEARRGEAEARGEVEFLRGEVERGRAELKRERAKAAAALKGAGVAMNGNAATNGSREVEQRDDEIRGLKAIIHSLSSGPDMSIVDHGRQSLTGNGGANKANAEELNRVNDTVARLEKERDELRGLVDRKAYHEEELERELQQLRSEALRTPGQAVSSMSNGTPIRTPSLGERSSTRDSRGTIVARKSSQQPPRQDGAPLTPTLESDTISSAEDSNLWCELCDSAGHNVLDCNSLNSTAGSSSNTVSRTEKTARTPDAKRSVMQRSAEGVANGTLALAASGESFSPYPASLKVGVKSTPPGKAPAAPLPNPHDTSLTAAKGTGEIDPNKWCALCERDGHDSVSCPFEAAF